MDSGGGECEMFAGKSPTALRFMAMMANPHRHRPALTGVRRYTFVRRGKYWSYLRMSLTLETRHHTTVDRMVTTSTPLEAGILFESCQTHLMSAISADYHPQDRTYWFNLRKSRLFIRAFTPQLEDQARPDFFLQRQSYCNAGHIRLSSSHEDLTLAQVETRPDPSVTSPFSDNLCSSPFGSGATTEPSGRALESCGRSRGPVDTSGTCYYWAALALGISFGGKFEFQVLWFTGSPITVKHVGNYKEGRMEYWVNIS
ncbi:hypothetical protein C8J57DRAFT_1236032 [Mycena rebaudengoi]|nr:hypothetical protein C8J57DRAFT_1236032 [Mycena rebaudengoi]